MEDHVDVVGTHIQWPEAQAIDEVIREKQTDVTKFKGASFAPVKNYNFQQISYDVMNGPVGMTEPHALDTDPVVVAGQGMQNKVFDPMYFKEEMIIKESDILKLRRLGGTPQQLMSAAEMIAERTAEMDTRIETRIEHMRWTVAQTGVYNIIDTDRSIQYKASYGIPAGNLNVPVTVDWRDKTNSKPVEDIFKIVKEYFIQKGIEFEQCFFNQTTAEALCFSDDTKNYYSNKLNLSQDPLPQNIEGLWPSFLPGKATINNSGYYDATTKAFTPFLQDYKIVMLGRGDYVGQVMDVVSTAHIDPYTGGLQPGKFMFVEDTSRHVRNPKYSMIGGFYGLARVRRPSYIVVVDVKTT